jgi:hypothetical protein
LISNSPRDEQNQNGMLQALFQQFQALDAKLEARLTTLEVKIDKGKHVPAEDQPSVTPILVDTVSAYRAVPPPDVGHSQGESFEFIKRDARISLPRADCPRFNGENMVEWL